MNTFRNLLVLLLAFSSFAPAIAQNKYGADSALCVRNISLYREYYNQKAFKDALPGWRYVYANCPASTEHMYADGPTLLKWVMEKETDAARKEAYIDSILAIYDQRIVHFGKETTNLSRKMVEMLTLRPQDQLAIYNLGLKIDSLEPGKMIPSAATVWFQSATILLSQKKITPEQAMRVYEVTSPRVAGTANEPSYQQIFLGCELANCEVMIPAFQKQYDANPDDLENNKKIAAALADKCAGSELFYTVSKKIYDKEPSASAAANLARMSYEKNSFSEAAKYYNEAIEKETDGDKKARLHYELAASQLKLGQTGSAKTNAQRAAALKSGWGDPLILVAKIVASTKGCGDNDISQKSIFWLAVDKLQHAKSVDPSVASEANSLIATYSQYFPDKETLFFNNLKDGDSYTVPCLGETTTVKSRK